MGTKLVKRMAVLHRIQEVRVTPLTVSVGASVCLFVQKVWPKPMANPRPCNAGGQGKRHLKVLGVYSCPRTKAVRMQVSHLDCSSLC